MDWSLAATIERAKAQVRRDVAEGTVPTSVKGFAELHDHVDANGYGGAFEDGAPDPCDAWEFWNKVQEAVDAWIKSGGLEAGSRKA